MGYNFNCLLKNRKHIFEIKNNELTVTNIDAQNEQEETIPEINELIKIYYNKIKTDTAKSKTYLNSLDHVTLVKELDYLVKSRECLISLKERICDKSYRRGTSIFEKFESEVKSFFRIILDSIKTNRFSLYPEKAIIGSFVGQFNEELGTFQEDEYYDPINDVILIEKQRQEIMTFAFTLYPQVEKEEIVDDFNTVYNSLLGDIKTFKAIITAAGYNLVNWSGPKISRFINKNKLPSNWSTRPWLDSYKEHLIKKGVKPEEEQKISKAEKAAIKLQDKRCNVGQEDLIRVFKQGQSDLVHNAIDKMNLDTLKILMDSTLKCVEERLSDKAILSKFIQTYCSLSNTKEDYLTLTGFLYHKTKRIGETTQVNSLRFIESLQGQDFKPNFQYAGAWEHVTWEFMIKNQDYIETRDIVIFGKTRKGYDAILYNAPDTFFDKIFTKIPKDRIFYMNSAISYQYLKRMTPEELLIVFPDLTEDNVRMDEVVELYKKVDYSLLEKVIGLNKYFLKNATSLIVANKDKINAEICLMEREIYFGSEDLSSMLNLFSYKDKVNFILKNIRKESEDRTYQYSYREKAKFEGTLELIFNNTELSLLLKEILEEQGESKRYIESLCEAYKKNKGNLESLNEILLNSRKDDFYRFPLTENTVGLLTNETKVKILKGAGVDHLNNPVVCNAFFKTLKRKDLVTCGENILNSRYIVYIAHVLSDEEKEQTADNNNAFLRANLDLLKMSYLKKYKNPEVFKTCVGNRVFRENKYFAQQLSRKLGITIP